MYKHENPCSDLQHPEKISVTQVLGEADTGGSQELVGKPGQLVNSGFSEILF